MSNNERSHWIYNNFVQHLFAKIVVYFSGSTDDGVLRALRHQPRRSGLLAALGDASRYGCVGACTGAGLTQRRQLSAWVLIPLPLPGQTVSIGCAFESWLLPIRLQRVFSGGGGGCRSAAQSDQNSVVAISVRQIEGLSGRRHTHVVLGFWRWWRNCKYYISFYKISKTNEIR